MIQPETFHGYPLDWVHVRWLAENLPDSVEFYRARPLCATLYAAGHRVGDPLPIVYVSRSVKALGEPLRGTGMFPIAGEGEWSASRAKRDFYRLDTEAGRLRYTIIELWHYIIDNREAILNEQK